MQLYSDADAKEPSERALAAFGYAPEHNYPYFTQYKQDPTMQDFFADFGGKGLLGRRKKGKMVLFSSPIAPKDEHVAILLEFLKEAFTDQKLTRVEMELELDTKRKLIASLSAIGLQAKRPKYFYIWPIFDMTTWDGDRLEGEKWKDIRYYWNKVHREHQVSFVAAEACRKEQLHTVVDEWKRERSQRDTAEDVYFHTVIDQDFAGYDHVRICVVDGTPRTITAGFRIPNSNGYYSSIGLYGRAVDRIGIVCNLDDLRFLKQQGYAFVNFGGGDRKLTEFKLKFKPSSTYSTHLFDVIRNDHDV
jgi:hypothetical protein